MEELPLKLIEDLGMQYTSDTQKTKRRFGIFECPCCGEPFRVQVISIKSGNTTKCNACARKLAGVKHRVADKDYMELYNKHLFLKRTNDVSEEFIDYNYFKEYVISIGYTKELYLSKYDITKPFSKDNLYLSKKIQKSKPRADIPFQDIYHNLTRVLPEVKGRAREVELKCSCGTIFVKQYRSLDKSTKEIKCKQCNTQGRALSFEPNQAIGSSGITFAAPSKLGLQYSIMKCGVCNKEFEGMHSRYTNDAIKSCGCSSGTSFLEREVVSFIESLGVDFETGNRKLISPKEVDIYIPEFKLAIEFNGLHWHSDLVKQDKNYHYNKHKALKEQGIELIHIFEHQWVLNRVIIEDIIKKRLHIIGHKIYARECIVKKVSNEDSKIFLNNNHLQGSINSKVNLGLYYKEELISIMTFGASRFNKSYSWELHRFANKLGYLVVGGASKLLKAFRAEFEGSLLSYCDISLFSGKVYESLGFTLLHYSKPNYWYFKDIEVHSRVKFQKHKLSKLLTKFNEEKTEWQNMVDNGWNRYWDCGNAVYIIN